MGVGLQSQSHAAGPDFDKVKSKVGSHRSENRSYKPKAARVQIFDDKEYMRKVKRMHGGGGGEKRRRNKSRNRDDRPSSLQLQRVEDDMRGYESEPNHRSHRYR